MVIYHDRKLNTRNKSQFTGFYGSSLGEIIPVVDDSLILHHLRCIHSKRVSCLIWILVIKSSIDVQSIYMDDKQKSISSV